MARHGCYANRSARHRQSRAEVYAAAPGDKERLAAAFDWFRSSALLLSRRRVPAGIDQAVHRQQAMHLMRDAALYLRGLAEAIDRGDYDTEKR